MKILMVCLGNICRSPLAEGIMRSKLPKEFLVDSAGTISMHQGNAPDKRSIKTAAKYNIDISKQSSRPITFDDLNTFDKIYCMDFNNLEDVTAMAKTDQQKSKISLLMDSANLSDFSKEVPDPYWDGIDGFEKVFLQLNEACEIIAKDLVNSLEENQNIS